MANTIYTIGHSNYKITEFLYLIKQHEIEVIADVRSAPYSKYAPQYNKDVLKKALNNNGIKYLFLGSELGARPADPDCYINGRVCFEKLKETPLFQQGISRLLEGAKNFKVCLLCSEKDPINCHRTILVARTLAKKGVVIQHILENGAIIDQAEIEKQMLEQFKLEPGLFDNNMDILIQDAYEMQEKNVSYKVYSGAESSYEG